MMEQNESYEKEKRRCCKIFESALANYLVNYREECINQGPLHKRAYA